MRHIIWITGFAIGLSACGDPLRDVARLGDVSVDGGGAAVSEAPSEARQTGGGLFGRLLNRTPEDPTNAAIEAALDDAQAAEAAEPLPEAPARGGLFGGNRTATAATGGTSSDVALADAATSEATVVPAAAAPAANPADPPRRGLAGLFRRAPDASVDVPRSGPDSADVPPGTALPFGEIARACNVPRNDLGREIDNVAGFRIYDTIPNTTAQRPFYITGFDDNCARTFTGAVVISGDVESHEYVRYQPSNERIGYTSVDNAYEALKAGFCRVGRGQPCGARTDRLNQNTQFITVYGFFGGNFSAVPTEWVQILVHDGRVLAVDLKEG